MAEEEGMVWYAVCVERDYVGHNVTTQQDHIVEESVVGSHLIDSNKFIKSTANNATSQAETDRHGGVQQSVSNTSCVELNRTINGGVLIQHKINNIKLYAAYTTGSATSYNFSGTHTLKPKLNNNTLQYYILQQPTNPS